VQTFPVPRLEIFLSAQKMVLKTGLRGLEPATTRLPGANPMIFEFTATTPAL
jgi:hypothetical protein